MPTSEKIALAARVNQLEEELERLKIDIGLDRDVIRIQADDVLRAYETKRIVVTPEEEVLPFRLMLPERPESVTLMDLNWGIWRPMTSPVHGSAFAMHRYGGAIYCGDYEATPYRPLCATLRNDTGAELHVVTLYFCGRRRARW